MLFFFKNIWSCQKFVVILHAFSVKEHESVAQQVEHIPFKDGVLGSSPSWFTRETRQLASLCFTSSYTTIFTIRPGTTMTRLG